jgi:hypothetical protein
MASTPVPRHDIEPGHIAAWSAVVGLLTVLLIGALSGRLLLDERAGGTTVFGALGFIVAFMAPFVATLASFLARTTELRRSIWLVSGALALVLGGLTIFSGVGLLLGAVGVGLISAWWLAKGQAGIFGSARSIALAGWLLLWLGGALAALWLHETPVCWNSGANSSGWVAARLPNDCWSDIIDDTEGVLALVGVAMGLAGMALIVRNGSADGDVA